jgi:hypothetical protein
MQEWRYSSTQVSFTPQLLYSQEECMVPPEYEAVKTGYDTQNSDNKQTHIQNKILTMLLYSVTQYTNHNRINADVHYKAAFLFYVFPQSKYCLHKLNCFEHSVNFISHYKRLVPKKTPRTGRRIIKTYMETGLTSGSVFTENSDDIYTS